MSGFLFAACHPQAKPQRHNTAGLVVAWGSMGRLRPEDIPEAAVDFHISSIIEGLLANPSIKSAATSAAAQIGDEPAGVLKSAMWRYSGSVNLRKPLEVQCKATSGSTSSIGHAHDFCTAHSTPGAGSILLTVPVQFDEIELKYDTMAFIDVLYRLTLSGVNFPNLQDPQICSCIAQACTRHEEDAREQKSKQLWPVWETARHAAEAWAHQYIHARFWHA